MTKYIRAGLAAAAIATVAIAGIAPAFAAKDSGPFSSRVRNACKGDKRISKGCVRALVDAGEVPRAMLSGN